MAAFVGLIMKKLKNIGVQPKAFSKGGMLNIIPEQNAMSA